MTLLRISKIKRVCVMHLAPRMFLRSVGAPGKFHRLNYITVWKGHDRDGADDGRKIHKVVLPPSRPFCHVGKHKMPYEILPPTEINTKSIMHKHLSTTRISETKFNADSETTDPADKKGNSVIPLEGVRCIALEEKSTVLLRARNIKMIKLQANVIKFMEQAFEVKWETFDYCDMTTKDMTTKHFKIEFNAETEMNDKAAAITQKNEKYLKFCPVCETQYNISFDDIMECKRTPNTLLVRSSVKEKKKTEKKKERNKNKITENKDLPLLAATIVSEENKKFLNYFARGVLVHSIVPTESEISGSVSKGSVKKELKEPAPNIQTAEEIAQSYIQAQAFPDEQVAAPCIFEDPLPDINLRDETIPLTEILQCVRERNRIMYCREVGQQLALQMNTLAAYRPPAGPCPPLCPPLCPPPKPPCPMAVPVSPPLCPSPWPPLCPPPCQSPCPPQSIGPWPPPCPETCPPCPCPCPPPCRRPCPPCTCPCPPCQCPCPPPCPRPCPPCTCPCPPCPWPYPAPCPPPSLGPWPPCPAPTCPECPNPCQPCPPAGCPNPCGPNLFPPPCPSPMRPPSNPPPPFPLPQPESKSPCPPPKGPPPPPSKPPPPPCPPCPPPPPPKCPPPPPPKSPLSPPPKCPPSPPPKSSPDPCPPPPKPKSPPCPPPPSPPPTNRPKRPCPPGSPPKCDPPRPRCPPPPRTCPPTPKPKPKTKPKPKCPMPTEPPPKNKPPQCPKPLKCCVKDAISLATHLEPVEKFPNNGMLPVLRFHKPDFRSLQNRNAIRISPPTSRDYIRYIFGVMLKTFKR